MKSANTNHIIDQKHETETDGLGADDNILTHPKSCYRSRRQVSFDHTALMFTRK